MLRNNDELEYNHKFNHESNAIISHY